MNANLWVTSLALVSTVSAWGQVETKVDGFKVSGRLDGYYSFNFNEPTPPATPTGSLQGIPASKNLYRYYDNYHNQLTLSHAELSIVAVKNNMTAVVDFDFGAYADLNSMAPYPASTTTDESTKHIGQAVMIYHAPDRSYFVEMGKMYAHLGAETVKASDNMNYSRSLTFSYGMPFWATGARVGYNFAPDKLQASVYVYNAWNQVQDNNRSKTLGLQLKYSYSPQLVLIYNYLGGAERADSESDLRQVHDVVVNYQATSASFWMFELLRGDEAGVNLPEGSQGRAEWLGALIGTSYQWTELHQSAVRAETYHDNQGYTTGAGPQKIQSYVLTHTYQMDEGLKLRAEWRSDFSDREVFPTRDENSKSQNTLLIAMMANF